MDDWEENELDEYGEDEDENGSFAGKMMELLRIPEMD